MKHVLLSSLLIFSGAALAQNPGMTPSSTQTIQWVIQDVPPFIEVHSPKTFVELTDIQGPGQLLHKSIVSGLPQYEHRFIKVPLGGVDKTLNKKRQFCSVTILESKERNKFLLFGEEVAVSPPQGLVTLRSIPSSDYVFANEEVDVAKTLEQKKFRMGVVAGRFYTPQLAPILDRDTKAYRFTSDGLITNLFNMTQTKRIDGVIAYYMEMASYERQHPEGEKLQFLRIKEAPDFIVLRASCERSQWGENALKDISKVIRERNLKEIGHQYLLSVLPPERRKEYQKIYESRPARN